MARKYRECKGQLLIDFDNAQLKYNTSLYTPEIQERIRRQCVEQSLKTNGAVSADDLLSVCHLCIAKQFEKFNSRKANFSTWVLMKTKWAIKDYFRSLDTLSRKQRGKVKNSGTCYTNNTHAGSGAIVSKDIGDIPPDMELSYEDDHEDGELLEIVRNRIKNLPPQLGRVVSLIYIDGLSPYEVSKELGMSFFRVKSLEKEAIKQMRENLKGINGRGLLPNSSCFAIGDYGYFSVFQTQIQLFSNPFLLARASLLPIGTMAIS